MFVVVYFLLEQSYTLLMQIIYDSSSLHMRWIVNTKEGIIYLDEKSDK